MWRKNFLTEARKLLFYTAVAHINISDRTIFDARVGFEIKEGYAITVEFVTIDVVEKWPKMILPSSEELIQKVKDMEKDLADRKFGKIQMNFAFRDPTGGIAITD